MVKSRGHRRVSEWCWLPPELGQYGSQVIEEHARHVMGETVPADHPQDREVPAIGWKCVGGHQPSAFLQAA